MSGWWLRSWLALVMVLASLSAGAQTVPVGSSSLPERGSFKVGEEGFEGKLPGNIWIRLAPGSQVLVERATQLKLMPFGPATHCHVLRLLSGTLEFDVPAGRSLPHSLLVFAPRRMSAASQGGRGLVMATDSTVTVANYRGKMVAAVREVWKPLAEGSARSIDQADHEGKPRPILPAPQFRVPSRLVVAINGVAAPMEVSASPVREALRYQLVLLQRVKDREREAGRWESNQPGFSLDALGPGRYLVRGYAVDTRGLNGYGSEPIELHVLGVRLPKGAWARGLSFQLGRHQVIELSETTGVEASFGSAERFAPLPSQLGLPRGQPLLVRLRLSGDQQQTVLLLEPRSTRAEIRLEPRRATWPEDQVTVEVRVHDGHGREVPSDYVVRARVTINAEPIELRWTRRGGTLKSVLPTQPMPGPWVVRVEAFDDLGESLGREFLEVAPSYPRPRS